MKVSNVGSPSASYQRMDGSSAATSNLSWHWLYRVGGVAALMISVLFLIGIVGVIADGTQRAFMNGWLTPFQNNWLVVLFKLNAGLSGVQPDSLHALSLLDVAIMGLFCPMFLALYVALRRTSAAWTIVAASLPFLAIPVFLITSMAGRSALLLAGLIISTVMLRANTFGKTSAYVGIVAGALLLVGGDLGTAIFSSSNTIAVLIGVGYVLWVIWFFMVARRLFQLGQGVAREVT